MSKIIDKHNYLNKSIRYIKNTKIKEWDMVDGGFSIIKRKKLLSTKEITRLEDMEKLQRHIEIGKMSIRNFGLTKGLLQGFAEFRSLFAEKNNIKSGNILSIKKDAIFLIKEKIHENTFDGIEFKLKNTYSSFMLLDKTELYFDNKINKLTVKGINDEKVNLHKDFLLKFITDIIRSSELTVDNSLIFSQLHAYREEYLCGQLPIEHYREFNANSKFRLNKLMENSALFIDHISEEFIPLLDSQFNYIVILRQLINNVL